MENTQLLKTYQINNCFSIPIALQQFILNGELANFPDAFFKDPVTNKQFAVEFIKKIGLQMNGTPSHALRAAIADRFDRYQPIGFATLSPLDKTETFFYYLIVFPSSMKQWVVDPNDPCPVYLVKFRGHPDDNAKSKFVCEMHMVAESFDAFIASLRN